MADYKGLSFEKLAKHADEGWALANHRTVQLREAMEALLDAEHSMECLMRRLGDDPVMNGNFATIQKVLGWGKRMFPGPGESLHDIS